MGLTIAILMGLGVGVAAFFATRKSSVEKPNLPVLASICAAALTLFVVTFAFLAVSASQALASARKDTFNEAGALRELWWARPAMARGETSVPTQETLNSVRMHVGEVVRDDPAVRAEALSRIHDVYTARRARVSTSASASRPSCLSDWPDQRLWLWVACSWSGSTELAEQCRARVAGSGDWLRAVSDLPAQPPVRWRRPHRT